MILQKDDVGRYYWLDDNVYLREGTFTRDFKNIRHLIDDHWREARMAPFTDEIDVDLDYYRYLESYGKLICTGCMIGDEYHGYMIASYTNHPLVKTRTVANVIGFFTTKESRKYFAGMKLIKFTEQVIRERYDADVMQVSVTIKRDMTKYLHRLGFIEHDVVASKFLKES